MAVLLWHADRLPAGPMQESDLLFPSETGGFRSPTVLDKPFKDVCQHLSLGKKVTPKAMRRTFQDLARRGAVDGLVQRSICGHLTEEMTERYSSVAQAEVDGAREGRLARRLPVPLAERQWREGAEWWESGGKDDLDSDYLHHITVASRRYDLAFPERDIGFEPTTFSLGS
jgi:hypothetical protein